MFSEDHFNRKKNIFIGYSKINCTINYTWTGKYCKLINCSAWWRLMSPTASVVPFSNLLATVFKKHNSLKKSWVWCNWCVLCRRIKRESNLSLCEPRSLFKGFNQNPIKKTHWVRPKSHTSLLYSMRKTVCEASSMSEFIVFEKQ